MISYKVYNQQGEAVADIKLSAKVFGQKPNDALVHQVAVAQMGNERQVLAHTKDRSEVRGGGRKPWRQKGTGRARVGSSRSPIWKGGGVTFGPTSGRNFSKKINDKMRRKALCIALSDKTIDKHLAILDVLEATEYKTKSFKTVVEKLEDKALPKSEKRSILIIDAQVAPTVKGSAKNLVNVKVQGVANINLLDVLKYKNIILTKQAVEALEKRYQ